MPVAPTYVPGTSYLTSNRPRVGGASDSFLSRIQSEKDRFVQYLETLFAGVDKNTLTMGVSLATTLGLGGLAAWYFHRKRQEMKKKLPFKNKMFSIDETQSPVKIGTGIAEEGDAKQPGILVLHQCPRGRKTPCIAPYPLKLETFLRVNGINYEADFTGTEPRSHGSPWITLDLEDISDSQVCLQYIVNKYGVDQLSDYDEKERSLARAYNHLLENHLYWGIALWRWVYDGARSLGDIQLLPNKTKEVIPDVCRTVEQAAWFHGLGKKAPNEVIASVTDDLKSLSEFLGNKRFFLGGDKATELDCTAFAMLSQMLWNMEGSPYQKAVKETYKNLSDFCWRMRVRYWPDWDNCLNNTELLDDEKPQTVD